MVSRGELKIDPCHELIVNFNTYRSHHSCEPRPLERDPESPSMV
jgi:hypothetical protein